MTRYLVSPTSSSISIASFPGSCQLMKEGGVNTEVGPGVDLELAYVDPASSQAFQKLSYKENMCVKDTGVTPGRLPPPTLMEEGGVSTENLACWTRLVSYPARAHLLVRNGLVNKVDFLGLLPKCGNDQ